MSYSRPLKFSDEVKSRLQNTDNKILITGGSGWIGRATIAMLLDSLENSFYGRTEIFTSTGREIKINNQQVITRPLQMINEQYFDDAYLIHLAFVTKEKSNELSLDEYIFRNQAISDLVTTFAKSNKIAGGFIPSTGAIYKANGDFEDDIKKNPYGFLKLLDEQKFLELDVDLSRMAQIRLFNLAGPFMNKSNDYALGSIINNIYSGGPIELRSNYPVLRSYVHVADLVELSFQIMLGMTAGPATPFDTATDQTIEIGELAQECKKVLRAEQIEIIRNNFEPSLKEDRYVGDKSTFLKLVSSARIKLAPIKEQISDTAEWLASSEYIQSR